MAFPNVSDIIATTIERRSGKIADNVTKNNAILAKLARKGKIRTVPGGRLIYEELAFAENPNSGWYSGYDVLPVSPGDVLSAAEFNWKQAAVPVVVSGLERLQNSGEDAIIDLVSSRLDVAESTMKNLISQGAYSDGTGSGGKQLAGLDAAVPEDPTIGTYGNISRVNYNFWRSQVLSTGGVAAAATVQGFMNQMWAKCVRGMDRPDLILADTNSWAAYMASLQLLQRFTTPESASLGFPAVKYMDADVVLDGGIGGFATSQRMYFLNTDFIFFRPHADRYMVPLSPGKRYAVNQDADVQILAFAGAMTSSGPQFCGRIRFV